MKTRAKILLIVLITILLTAVLSISGIVNAADTTSNVKLEANSTEQIHVTSGNVTVDLNGKELTVAGSAIVVEKGATATITGNGTVKATGSTHAAILNKGGTVIIKSGKFNSENWYTVKNLGTMTIEGGEFTQGSQKANSSLIENGWYDSTSNHGNDVGVAHVGEEVATLNIKGGSFIHKTTTSTVKSDDYSKTVITGGDFESQNGNLIQATGEVEVSGGNFKGYKTLSLFNGDGSAKYEPAKLTISDGNFNTRYIIRTFTAGTLNISGGEFEGLEKVRDPRPEEAENVLTKNITGGTYNFNINDSVAEGYTTYAYNNKFVVNKEVQSFTAPSQIIIKKGETTSLGVSVDTMLKDYLQLAVQSSNIVKITDGTITGLAEGKTKAIANLGGVATKEIQVVVYEVKQANETQEVESATTIVDNIVDDVITGKENGLTNEQKTAIRDAVVAGKTLVVDVPVAKVEVAEVKADADKASAVLSNTAKVAGYFDINLVIKDTAGTELTKLTNLKDVVEVTLDIPENIPAVAEGYTREYTVIRVHDGKAEELETTYNEDGTVTFKSNKFSTYVLAYTDTSVKAPTTTTTEDAKVTPTGDNIVLYVVLLIVSVIGMVVAIRKLKK